MHNDYVRASQQSQAGVEFRKKDATQWCAFTGDWNRNVAHSIPNAHCTIIGAAPSKISTQD
jgi:hypothetical protein